MAKSAFTMIDVGRKRTTRRRAIAGGRIVVGKEAFIHIRDKTLPKGDVLALTEMAGIGGAKKTSDILPLCHNLPLDQVSIHCVLHAPDAIDVYCQVATHAKTGVEMEAIMGVQAALSTIWDLAKVIEPALAIEGIRLIVKEGGKSGLWLNPGGVPDWISEQLPANDMQHVKSAILVMSDRASDGTYEDKSGPLLQNLLETAGANVIARELVTDDAEKITDCIRHICDTHAPDLLLASGGTGPGPRDVTPEAVRKLCDRMLDGLGELLRRESAAFTDTAWLSRMNGGMYGHTLIVTLPGSPKAVQECWEIVSPFIGRSLKMIAQQGHKKEAAK